MGVAWQVYQLTHSPLALGSTGLALFLPGIFFVLVAGHVADRYDRRNVLMGCYAVQFVATVLLLWMSLHGVRNVWLIYAVLFLIGTGRCFSGPAASALLPSIVPKEHFVNAVTWGATIFQVANATGPMVGGFLFTAMLASTGALAEWNGAPLVYSFTLAALALYLVFMGSIPLARRLDGEEGLHGADHAGRHSVRGEHEAAAWVDLPGSVRGAAGRSGEPDADLRGGGSARGAAWAWISASGPQRWIAVGLAAAGCVSDPQECGQDDAGVRGDLRCGDRGVWPFAHVVLSMLALFITGATDMVSVVVRSSILQLATPPEMRGRVSSVNWLFLGASNEFGEFESGLTAHWWGAVRAVVVGGVASMTVTGLWTVFFPALRRVDQLTAESLTAAEQQMSADATERPLPGA